MALNFHIPNAFFAITIASVFSMTCLADNYVDRTVYATGEPLTVKILHYSRMNKGPIPYPYFYEDPNCDACGGYDPYAADIVSEGLQFTVVSLKDKTLALTFNFYDESGIRKENDGKYYLPAYVDYNGEKFTVIGTYRYATFNWPEGSTVVFPSTIRFIGEDINEYRNVTIDISNCRNLEHIDRNDYFPLSEAVELPEAMKTVSPEMFAKNAELKGVWAPRPRHNITVKSVTPPKFILDTKYDAENYPWLMKQRWVGYPREIEEIGLKVPDEAYFAYATADYWRMFDDFLNASSGKKYLEALPYGDFGADFYFEPTYHKDASSAQYDFAVNNICYSVIDSDKVEIRSNILYSENHPCEWNVLTVPSKVVHDGITYSVVRMGDYSFAGELPHGKSATYSAYSYNKLSLPASLKEIGTHVLVGEKLNGSNELVIPSSIEIIGAEAFRACGHTSAVIPAGVKALGHGIFRDSPISKITMKGKTPPAVCHPGAFAFINSPTVTVYVPAGSKEAYKAAIPFKWMNIKEQGASSNKTGARGARTRK